VSLFAAVVQMMVDDDDAYKIVESQSVEFLTVEKEQDSQ
jgi:hypothetical protein